MIGNDVIDLALAKTESSWNRPGFLDKIFTTNEQLMIKTSVNKDKKVWDLWSRKEAVYKIFNRKTNLRTYIPLELECFDLETVDGSSYGKVNCRGEIYFTKTTITDCLIDTVAVTVQEDFNKIQYLANDIVIYRENAMPSYFYDACLKPISVSHHGHYKMIITLL